LDFLLPSNSCDCVISVNFFPYFGFLNLRGPLFPSYFPESIGPFYLSTTGFTCFPHCFLFWRKWTLLLVVFWRASHPEGLPESGPTHVSGKNFFPPFPPSSRWGSFPKSLRVPFDSMFHRISFLGPPLSRVFTTVTKQVFITLTPCSSPWQFFLCPFTLV